jgi:hypothetical protein
VKRAEGEEDDVVLGKGEIGDDDKGTVLVFKTGDKNL